MACSSNRMAMTRPVWSPGATSTGHFLVYRRMRVEEWIRFRCSLIVEAWTGSDEWSVTAGARYANQEQDLASATFVTSGVTQTLDGTEYGTAYTVFDTDWQWVEIGVQVANLDGRPSSGPSSP